MTTASPSHAQLSKSCPEQCSDEVDDYGFLSLHEKGVAATEATNRDAGVSAALPSDPLWSGAALQEEESWWASDLLLYLSWKAALCTRTENTERRIEHSHASGASTPVASSCNALDSPPGIRVDALPPSPFPLKSAVESATRTCTAAGSPGAASVSCSSSHHLLPPVALPSREEATDTALMEQWFRGRWEARLRHYGGCPHMSLRLLLWGFFSGAWQQSADDQAAEAAQYTTMPAEPAASVLAAQPEYAAALEAIDRDIGRTFPHHILFHGAVAGSTGQRQLRRLLRAYAARDPEVGYCQGMAFVAAVVLMVAAETEAYQIFCGLMRDDGAALSATASPSERHGMRQLYRSGFPLLQTLLAELENHVRSLLPALAAHLQASDVHVGMFASRWFLTLFVHQLPPPLLLRVWDFFMIRGWAVMVQVAVALLHQEQGTLLKLNLEGILLHLKDVRSQRQSEGELLRRVCNVPLL